MTAAARIAHALVGRPVKPRNGNYLVCCPAHNDKNPSLSLRDGDRGLLIHCFAGCPPGNVYAAIRRSHHHLLAPGDAAPKPAKGSGEDQRRQHEKAAWLWSRRQPIAGTIAERYLREARGISCPLPPTIAYLRPLKPEHQPAMIAGFGLVEEPEPGVLDAPRDVISVHLTLLKADGSGKADTKPNKIIIGRPLGRPIVLAPVNDLLALAVAEGIEDALSVHAATGFGAWAAGAAAFMPKLADTIPGYVTSITIETHADETGRRGATELAHRLRARVPHKDERPIEVIMREATS